MVNTVFDTLQPPAIAETGHQRTWKRLDKRFMIHLFNEHKHGETTDYGFLSFYILLCRLSSSNEDGTELPL